MYYTGLKSMIYIGTESEFNTEATLKYQIPFLSESINEKKEVINSEALLGNRAKKAVVEAKRYVSGTLELEAYPEIFGYMFLLGLGWVEKASDHIKITPVKVFQEIPSSTMQVSHGDVDFIYTGMKVNQIKLSSNLSKQSFSVDFEGIREYQKSGTLDLQPFSYSNPFTFRHAKIAEDDVDNDNVLEFELTIKNNLETEDYVFDDFYRQSLSTGGLEIEGNMKILFDINEYSKYKDFQKFKLVFAFDNGIDKFEIELPNAKFFNVTHDVTDIGKIQMSCDFLATGKNLIEVRDYTSYIDDLYLPTGVLGYWTESLTDIVNNIKPLGY